MSWKKGHRSISGGHKNKGRKKGDITLLQQNVMATMTLLIHDTDGKPTSFRKVADAMGRTTGCVQSVVYALKKRGFVDFASGLDRSKASLRFA